jgi:hypothetical protein
MCDAPFFISSSSGRAFGSIPFGGGRGGQNQHSGVSALFCNVRTIQFQDHAWSCADRAERARDRMGLQVLPGVTKLLETGLIPGPIFNIVWSCDERASGPGNYIVTDPRDENKVRL